MATPLQHPGTLIRALSALELARFRFSSELELQAGIAEVLTGAVVPFEREARIGDRETIDFLLAGEIGAEEYAAARGRLQAEREAAQLELADLTAPLENVAQKASAFAIELMTRPAEVWQRLDGDRRAIFAERMFQDGITFAEGELSNHAEAPLDGAFRQFQREGCGMVGPTATSSNPDAAGALLAWRARYEATAAALLRAA